MHAGRCRFGEPLLAALYLLTRRERAECDVLAGYLPAQHSDEELAALAVRTIDEVAAELGERPGPRQMAQVMKVATAKAAGRAEGSRLLPP